MIDFYLKVGILIISTAALYFSIHALCYNLYQARKWYNIAKGYKETIKFLAGDLSPEEMDVLFAKFTIVEKDAEF